MAPHARAGTENFPAAERRPAFSLTATPLVRRAASSYRGALRPTRSPLSGSDKQVDEAAVQAAVDVVTRLRG